ncbi:MAG: DUF4832 domain-containing protein [bacterium]|nr:DUF4832 domain-containing protein [bacterium]
MSTRKRIIMYLLTAVVLVIATVVLYTVAITHYSYQYNRTEEVLANPMMGFAPNADYTAAVGENTLVYVDVTWRELEPEQGKFAFDAISKENQLAHWREQGKKVVFRFMCDVPGETKHMDIPDWLYERTKDGEFYDSSYGKGYSPEYENPIFIKYHEKAIAALGAEYGTDTFFCFVELGSLGHWGEWHVKYDEGVPLIPRDEVCNIYVEHYVNAFPNAKLLMRRPFSAVKTYGLGVFNDMTGEITDTNTWLEWMNQGGRYTEPKETHQLATVPEIWNSSPVGGEFTSTMTMEHMLTTNLSTTLELLEKTHMTFIGPKCPIANEEAIKFPAEVKKVLETVGYRYGVSKARIAYNSFSNRAKVNIKMCNYGVAPMYFNWPVYLYLLDQDQQVISKIELPINLMEIAQNQSRDVEMILEEECLQNGMVKVAIGIENPDTNQPEVALDMDSTSVGKKYILNE